MILNVLLKITQIGMYEFDKRFAKTCQFIIRDASIWITAPLRRLTLHLLRQSTHGHPSFMLQKWQLFPHWSKAFEVRVLSHAVQ